VISDSAQNRPADRQKPATLCLPSISGFVCSAYVRLCVDSERSVTSGPIARDAAEHADAILIPCRPSALDLGAIGASVRIARNSGKPFFVVINAAPTQGVEIDEMRAALAGAGVDLAPVVMHQRKAFAARMQEGRTAPEIEPQGKAAAEVRELLLWVCDKVINIPISQVTELPRQRA